VRDLLPVLEQVMQAGRPLLRVAEDVGAEASATLIVKKLKGAFTSVAVKAPRFGDRCKATPGGTAILTGGTVISERAVLVRSRPGMVNPTTLTRRRRSSAGCSRSRTVWLNPFATVSERDRLPPHP